MQKVSASCDLHSPAREEKREKKNFMIPASSAYGPLHGGQGLLYIAVRAGWP